MAQLALRCLECRYTWKPRKDVTRYRRQCPKCDSYRLEELGESREVKDTTQPVRTMRQESSRDIRWPKIAYDLMGISGASSPENAIAKAIELYRRALPYRFKYDASGLEEVFKLLENKASDASKRLQSILHNPELVFYETVGADLAPTEYYEAIRDKGYRGSFLDFLTDIVCKHFKSYGYDSPQDFRAEPID